MELKNNRDFKILRIGQIVHSVSETHKFDKERLIAINTSFIAHQHYNSPY